MDETHQKQDPAFISGDCGAGDTTGSCHRPTPVEAEPAPDATWEKKAVGRFRSLKFLGRGAFGSVYRAYDPQLNRLVALKFPRADLPSGSEQLRRFFREARAAARLHHPHIVTIHDIGRCGDTDFIVSEYVEGTTLRHRLREGPLYTPSEAAALIAKLAEALHYAHQQGVIHRDVKPENGLLDARGEPLLADFGLARSTHDETLTAHEGVRLGTPAYMSPEQCRGASHDADARSDLWSLGVMLFELLTGERPFTGSSAVNTMLAILRDPPRPPRSLNPDIPADLEAVCLRCLAKDPGSRYATGADLARDLQTWLQSLSVSGRSRRSATIAWRHICHYPLAAVAIIAVLCTLLVASAYLARAPVRGLVTDDASKAEDPLSTKAGSLPAARSDRDSEPADAVADKSPASSAGKKHGDPAGNGPRLGTQEPAHPPATKPNKPSMAVGGRAPSFSGRGLDGQLIDLADERSEVRFVLLDFWASWCGPCRAEFPTMRRLHARFKDHGLRIVGINLDTDLQKARQAVEESDLDYPHVFDGQGWKNAVAQLYDVHAIPAVFLLDKDGRIVAQGLRGAALEERLRELLGPGSNLAPESLAKINSLPKPSSPSQSPSSPAAAKRSRRFYSAGSVAKLDELVVTIDKDLKYVAEQPRMGIRPTWSPRTPAQPRPQPYLPLVKEPAYKSRQVLYGYVKLGNSNQNQFTYVLDDLETPMWVVYFDRNGNRDLTDDGPPLSNHGHIKLATGVALDVPIVNSSGATIARPYHLWFFVNELGGQVVADFYSTCHYQGSLRILGKPYAAVAFESPTFDALYVDHGLWIDLNGDGQLDRDTENFRNNEIITVDGKEIVLRLWETTGGVAPLSTVAKPRSQPSPTAAVPPVPAGAAGTAPPRTTTPLWNRELVLCLAVGVPRGPGKVLWLDGDANRLHVLELPNSANGVATQGDALVLAIPDAGVVRVRDQDRFETLLEGGPLKCPIDVAVSPSSGDVAIADNDADLVLWQPAARGAGVRTLQRLTGSDKSFQNMSVAVTRDGFVILGTSEPSGIYRFRAQEGSPLGAPLLAGDGDVAADPSSPCWAASQVHGVHLFEQAQQTAVIPYPTGVVPYRGGILAFGPDRSLVVALLNQGAAELHVVDISRKSFRKLFSWTQPPLKDFAIVRRTAALKSCGR